MTYNETYTRGSLMKVFIKAGELSRLLDEKGLRKPYRDLARKFECSATMIGMYLNDRIESPSLEMMAKWAAYLGVTVDDLIVVEHDADEGK